MQDTIVFGGDWSPELVIDGDCSLDLIQDGSAQVVTAIRGGYPIWSGETEFTPAQEEQIIPTAGFLMSENIIIKPIPNSYGLISWNGSVLTVS